MLHPSLCKFAPSVPASAAAYHISPSMPIWWRYTRDTKFFHHFIFLTFIIFFYAHWCATGSIMLMISSYDKATDCLSCLSSSFPYTLQLLFVLPKIKIRFNREWEWESDPDVWEGVISRCFVSWQAWVKCVGCYGSQVPCTSEQGTFAAQALVEPGCRVRACGERTTGWRWPAG